MNVVGSILCLVCVLQLTDGRVSPSTNLKTSDAVKRIFDKFVTGLTNATVTNAIARQRPAATRACDLTGEWTNQHGSEVSLTLMRSGRLSGRYVTAVESAAGAAGSQRHSLVGQMKANLFTFHVFWTGGRSVTTWTGHCHNNAKGQPVLQTSWILTEAVDDCADHWMSNRMGQDTFSRKQDSRHLRTHQNA